MHIYYSITIRITFYYICTYKSELFPYSFQTIHLLTKNFKNTKRWFIYLFSDFFGIVFSDSNMIDHIIYF